MALSKKKRKRKNQKENKFFQHRFFLIGLGLIFLALLIPILIFFPVVKAEISYHFRQKGQVTVETQPIDPEFSIIIPKINANAKIIKDVDPFNSKIYQLALSRGVAHAKGTALPGQAGNTFIFAHSAGNWYHANQFNAIFYLINKLKIGDEIILYHQSQKYLYSVQEIEIISSDEISYLNNQTKEKQLTLMTCWPPGTTLKRYIVVAKQL